MSIEHTKRTFPRKDVNALRKNILAKLKNSGFILDGNELSYTQTKDNIRALHEQSAIEMRKKYSRTLKQKETNLLKYIANGTDLVPEDIEPYLMYVDSSTQYWDLFNYIKIHWSIPISSGYGRRLCYIVFDKSNDKVIGILGLADPVFMIPARDDHIGWKKEEKNANISKIMDGYVIGAAPPYNMILGGKLVGSLLFSNQIRKDFMNKYTGTKSFISGKEHSGDLALISTLSALGKSAIYDRLKISDEQRFISCGYSKGWGEFQFNGEIYKDMLKLVRIYGIASEKSSNWGAGFRNKREVVQKSLRLLDIPNAYMKHGINREQFILPLAKNYKEVLTKGIKPNYYINSTEDISEFIKKRWILPRIERTPKYENWVRENYSLWGTVPSTVDSFVDSSLCSNLVGVS